MSKRLSISAALSVLMMSAYVVLGTGHFTSDFGPRAAKPSPGFASPVAVLPFLR